MATVREAPPRPAIDPGEIEVANVSRSYGLQGFEKVVVHDCSFTI